MTATPRNRLADATSPYLLQHADNPVHWYEWGEEAFAAARELDRPILLSVGYAACHWCHVMAHESFEEPATADVMNSRFINVKVDREERPDVDRIYMDAVQTVSGQGGWPMTVFLTPDGEPFFAGTYFPPEERHGIPSFLRVMDAVHAAWEGRRDQVVAEAARLTRAVQTGLPPAAAAPTEASLPAAYRALEARFDPVHGGFGGAPKFPQAPTLEFLLRIAGEPWAPQAGDMLEHTLAAMARGGIYDHLGGGFARYSVDARWLVPHFEKMLYDNALLARMYLRAGQVTGNPLFEQTARDTLEYLLADLRLPDGGFASAEDADSEGEEGRFYVFTHDEFLDHGGEQAALAARVFGVTPEGNFEGRNILHRARSIADVAAEAGVDADLVAGAVDESVRNLRRLRAGRVRPSLDDKVICAWNGLAVRAFAEAGTVLGEPAYVEAARTAARFLLDNLRRADGRLLRSWRRGKATITGFADDYASLAVALFTLYGATGETEWFTAASEITGQMIDLFWDGHEGGVHATGIDAETLIARPKNLFDNPTPSDNSLAAEALVHLAALTGDQTARERIEDIARVAGRLVERAPSAVGHLLAVLATGREPRELAIVGDPADPRTAHLRDVVAERFRPDVFVAVGDGADASPVPLLEGRPGAADGGPLAYLCRGFVCEAPTADSDELRAMLDQSA